MNASITSTPFFCAWRMAFSASAAFMAKGFSHSTCLPASAAFMTHSAWRLLGSVMYTASISLSARSSS